MSKHFQEGLDELKKKLLEMGSMVEFMINLSVKALVDRKPELTKDVFLKEEEVNRKQIEIDEMCLGLLALQQPIAADLRFIASAMKINSDLERMGDQAINMAETGQDLAKQSPLKPLVDIPRMAEIVKTMVKESLDSFVKSDAKLAESVLMKDDEVDELKNQIFKELKACMMSDNNNITRALDLILIARNLEKIGDHATNISEDVIFMVLGKDIRHHIEDR